MDFKLPHLGEGADSGTVVNLFVKEGDKVAKDQPVLELENEKAVATIPSAVSGTITRLYVRAGEKLSVGQRIFSVSGGEAAASQPVATPHPATAEPSETHIQTPSVEQLPGGQPPEEGKADGAVAAAPSIRKLARDLGLDLTRVRGSARGGRIVLEDVRTYIQRLQQVAFQAKPGGPAAKPAESIDFSKWGPITKKPLSGLRDVIARRMAENWLAVPRVTQFDEADITALNELRKKYAPAYEQKGARLTLTPFVIKAVVDTLKRYPFLNSSLDEAAHEIILKEYYHIGIAVDTEPGLIVPVIRNADRKSLLELSRELEELAKKARDRKASPEDLKGGTFTISNQGGIGGGHFTPIVNKPEVAILGLGRGALKPVVREKGIEPRLLLPLALSYDHRVVDGGVAARFTVDLVKALEGLDESLVRLDSSSS